MIVAAVATVDIHAASVSAPEGTVADTAAGIAEVGRHIVGTHSAAAVEGIARLQSSHTAGCTDDPYSSCVSGRGAITKHCAVSCHREFVCGVEPSLKVAMDVQRAGATDRDPRYHMLIGPLNARMSSLASVTIPAEPRLVLSKHQLSTFSSLPLVEV